MDDDVTAGLLQRENARHRCLAYRRKLHAADGQTGASGLGGSEELWQNVRQVLGASQAREYGGVGGPVKRGALTEDHESYLQRLCDDFVADTQELISRSLQKKRSQSAGGVSDRLTSEVLHHAALAKQMLGPADARDLLGKYPGLLQTCGTAPGWETVRLGSTDPGRVYSSHGGGPHQGGSMRSRVSRSW